MGRTVINETENKQTVILNDSPEGVEGGYFDSLMEWHEFGGGGVLSLQPIMHITLVNDGGDNPLTITGMKLNNLVMNGHIYDEFPYVEEIPTDGEYSWDALCTINKRNPNSPDVARYEVHWVVRTNHSGSGHVESSYELRTSENCTYDDDTESIIVTDITKEASAVMVVKYTIVQDEG